MNQRVSAILNKEHDIKEVNSLLVSAFVDINQLEVDDESILSSYLISESKKKKLLLLFEQAVMKAYGGFTLEMLIEFFEFVVSPSDKIVTGAIYTPKYIREVIVEYVFCLLRNRRTEDLKIADIACGCGGFFLTVCEKILQESNLDCHYIYEHILYGCDIEEYCIERTKILLSLKALQRGESIRDLRFNLYQGNSLCYNWNDVITGFTGFDSVVGNPPYVTSAKMSEETKALLDNWEVCKSGKADLYIPFFQIAIELLNDRGVLGYITVSNFTRSLNGKALRNYFSNHNLSVAIVDFGGEQVFKGCSTYTCLCFIDKQQEGFVRYVRTESSNFESVSNLSFVEADYDDLDSIKGWVIKDRRIDNLLRQIENTGRPLGEVVAIFNGIATLKNELYVLNVVEETEELFVHEYDGVRYPIERGICRQVVKPSALDEGTPVDEQKGWIIYPYEVRDKRAVCFDENQMERVFPNAFAYLTAVRPMLDKRDKGTREYEQWYAYGRNQAINLKGYRLLMPYIAYKPTFFLTNTDGLLYYNGFALISNNILTLERLQKVLTNDIFWFYVKNISKPYANSYYSMGKRYIRYFGVPYFSEEQLRELDATDDRERIDNLLYTNYFGEGADTARDIISQL